MLSVSLTGAWLCKIAEPVPHNVSVSLNSFKPPVQASWPLQANTDTIRFNSTLNVDDLTATGRPTQTTVVPNVHKALLALSTPFTLPLITQHTVYIPNLPQAAEGFRVAQISDPHFALVPDHEAYRTEKQQKLDAYWQDTAQQLTQYLQDNPVDAFLFTGDASNRGLDAEITLFDQFLSKLPLSGIPNKFAVLGNHDQHHGKTMPAEDDPIQNRVLKVLQGQGFKVLGHVTATEKPTEADLVDQFTKNGSPVGVYISGVQDYSSLYKSAALTPGFERRLQQEIDVIENATKDKPHITLLHNPIVANLFKTPPSLGLSGHTHGGQVITPADK